MSSGTVVIHTAFIGDLVLLTPLLSRLREIYPEEPLHLVTTPISATLFENDDRLDGVLVYDKHGRDSGFAGFRKMLRQLRRLQPRRIYLPHRYLRSSLLGLLAGAEEVSGFREAPLSYFFQKRVVYPRDMHETRRMLKLLEEPTEHIYLPHLDLTGVDVSQFDLPKHYIVLAPGSVWRSKRWPGYGSLAAIIKERYPNHAVVLVGVDGDSEQMGEEALAAGVDDLAGKTSLRETAAIIAGAAALVCNDSVALHLGQAVATPLVAVFGSTVTTFGFGPQGEEDRVVSHQLECRPCALHGVNYCPRSDFACIDTITPDEVMNALQRVDTLSA